MSWSIGWDSNWKRLLRAFKLAPSEDDRHLKNLIDNSYKSLRVVGRGSIKIDPTEVRNTDEFKEALKKVKSIREIHHSYLINKQP